MRRIPLEPGRVALATAGRDEGRRFVIVKIVDENFALISDGETRKIDHPKLKKKKHLKATADLMPTNATEMLTNAAIRGFLTGSSKKEG